jgi:uncharacterized protein with PIN domain
MVISVEAALNVGKRFAHACATANQAALRFKDTDFSTARHLRSLVASADGSYLVGRGGVCV